MKIIVDKIRQALDSLIRARGEDYASLSARLGRNPAYIQQFIKRGSPKRLAEEDRRVIARYFDVDEALLGGPPAEDRRDESRFAAVPLLDVLAAAGAGSSLDEGGARARIGFDPGWLRARGLRPDKVSVISVQGDSMEPSLRAGDDILVDHADAAEKLRDGVYVLRADDGLLVKRLAVISTRHQIIVRSDNPTYPDWPECAPDAITIIGRVVWVGRALG